MANRFFVNGGANNNWNDTGNWSTTSGGAGGASVPGTADDVFFDANSPNCTLDINTAIVKSVNFTGYTNTITFTNKLQCSGSVTLSNTMSFAGASILDLQGTSATGTLTSNGKTLGVGLTLRGSNAIWTLADNWVVLGLLTIGVSTSIVTVNGFQISCNGFTNGGTSGNIGGTTTIRLTGGTLTGATSSSDMSFNFILAGNITIDSGSNIRFAGSKTLSYESGTITTTGSTITISGDYTLDTNGITWNQITIQTTGTLTLSSDLTLATLFFNANGTISGTGKIFATVIDAGTNRQPTFLAEFEAAQYVAVVTTTVTTTTFANLKTFIIKELLQLDLQDTGSITLTSNHASNKANLILRYAAQQKIKTCNATRINSEGGQQIYAPFGTLTETLNWTATLQGGQLSRYVYSPVSISGTVKDTGGQPVQGAIVAIFARITENAIDYWFFEGIEITDVNGQYSHNVIDGSQAVAVAFYDDGQDLFTSIAKPFLDA